MNRKQLCCLLAAVAFPSAAAVHNIGDLGAFGRIAATALDDVGRFRPDFELGWMLPPREPTFFDGVKCERAHQFHINREGVIEAEFAIGACKAEAGRIRDLAVATEKSTKDAVDRLMAKAERAKPGDREKLQKFVAFRKVPLAGGAAGYSFTLMWIGHGFGFTRGAVVHDPKRQVAYIVMADVSELCGYSLPEGMSPKPSPFCPDTGKALLDVAAALARLDDKSSP